IVLSVDSAMYLWNVDVCFAPKAAVPSESAFDPSSVKTCTRGECAELFSLFSPFDGARQSGSFLIRRRRDRRDPELNSRPDRLFSGRLTGATSRRSVCVHRQGELKRGPVARVCRGPQPATVGF